MDKFFVNIGPKLTSMIPELQTKFDQHQNPHQNLMGLANLTVDELEEAWRILKPNRFSGYDNISLNVSNKTSDTAFLHLLGIYFQSLLQQGIFPKNFKIAKVCQFIRKVKSFYWQITDQYQFFHAFLNCWNIMCNSQMPFKKGFPLWKTIWFSDIS